MLDMPLIFENRHKTQTLPCTASQSNALALISSIMLNKLSEKKKIIIYMKNMSKHIKYAQYAK